MKNKTVIICDDEALLREMIVDFLKEKGVAVLEASNGAECLELAQKIRPDVILMDVCMPEMDGLEATRNLRIQGNQATILLTSGFCQIRSVEEAKKLGADDFIPKPFALQKIGKVVNSL